MSDPDPRGPKTYGFGATTLPRGLEAYIGTRQSLIRSRKKYRKKHIWKKTLFCNRNKSQGMYPDVEFVPANRSVANQGYRIFASSTASSYVGHLKMAAVFFPDKKRIENYFFYLQNRSSLYRYISIISLEENN